MRLILRCEHQGWNARPGCRIGLRMRAICTARPLPYSPMSTPCRTLAASRGTSFSKRIRLEVHKKGRQAAESLGRLLFFSEESKGEEETIGV